MRVERDLWQSLTQLWEDFKLDEVFQQEGAQVGAIVLWEAEVPPGAALPYCVVENLSYSVAGRSSGRGVRGFCEVREYVLRIHLFAGSRSSVTRLGESIQRAFRSCKGALPGSQAAVILMELNNSFVIKEEVGSYHGVLQYKTVTDVCLEK